MNVAELVSRMSRLFHGLIGRELEFQVSESLRAGMWAPNDLTRMRESDPGQLPKYFSSTDGASYGFPLVVNRVFVGLAVVNDWPETKAETKAAADEKTRAEKLMTAAEFFAVILENGLKMREKNERLRILEDRMRAQESAKQSNVIQFRSPRFAHSTQVTDTSPTASAATAGQPNLLVTALPLLIETKPEFPLHRIALEIHQLANRWAFLSFDDLPREIFNSREGVQQLGAVTLFIRDLTQLSPGQQVKLTEYLAIQPGLDMPQVLAGIQAPLRELEAQGKIIPQLARYFCHTSLHWSERAPEQINRELITASLQHILQQTKQHTAIDVTPAMVEQIVPPNVQYIVPEQSSLH